MNEITGSHSRFTLGDLTIDVGVGRVAGGFVPLEFEILHFSIKIPAKKRVVFSWFRVGKIKFHHF